MKRLEARLTDPESWLPASAWKQRKVRAYEDILMERDTRGVKAHAALETAGAIGGTILETVLGYKLLAGSIQAPKFLAKLAINQIEKNSLNWAYLTLESAAFW